MRLAGFAGGVIDQRIGQRHAVVGEIEASRVDAIERVEGRAGKARHPERIEDMDRAEVAAMAGGDAGIFALGVDADDRAGIVEQIGDDRAHALAGARRRDRQQMGWTGIAQRPARLGVRT